MVPSFGVILSWVILCFVIGFIGKSRKIGFAGAFFASLLLSPIIGLVITLVSKNKEDEAYKEKVLNVQKEQSATLEKLIESEKENKAVSSNKVNGSITDELKKLKDLRDSDVISEEEFANLKKRILGSLTNDSLNAETKPVADTSYKKQSHADLMQELALLRAKLKDDEVIVVDNESNQAKIISQEQYEWDKKKGISASYSKVGRY